MQAPCWPIVNLPELAKPSSFSFFTENLNTWTVCHSCDVQYCGAFWNLFLLGERKKLRLWGCSCDLSRICSLYSGQEWLLMLYSVVKIWCGLLYIEEPLCMCLVFHYYIPFLSTVLILPRKSNTAVRTVTKCICATCLHVLKLKSWIIYTFSHSHIKTFECNIEIFEHNQWVLVIHSLIYIQLREVANEIIYCAPLDLLVWQI